MTGRTHKTDTKDFLPVSREDMLARGWDWYDILLVTGDAYVDHPSFGAAVIGRLLENAGYRVAVLAQPAWNDASAFAAMGRPELGVFIGAGNLDSMVAHYTAAKKRRSEDFYSPGRKAGLRPDRACTVYANRARQAFPGIPVLLGGMEASLRRFAHYDYWSDSVMPSVLVSTGADYLMYGMGEVTLTQMLNNFKAGLHLKDMHDLRGICYLTEPENTPIGAVQCDSFEIVRDNKKAYAKSCRKQYDEQDEVYGRTIVQRHGNMMLVQNPPQRSVTQAEFDYTYELPYMRMYHPMYEKEGGVPAIQEVEFSITHNRGCFGFCNFCSIALHQGRKVQTRSEDSVYEEAVKLSENPRFKGYIHDVGGPTANFRHPACNKKSLCTNRRCLAPYPCPAMKPDHTEYLRILRRIRELPRVKKVFVRSGIRYDYLIEDKNEEFFEELVKHHISGQLKVAPEHCSDRVLDCMGKPHFSIYRRFYKRFYELNKKFGMDQYLVPYMISSHPGSTLEDAIELALYLKEINYHPEQVQDFYPTPGTVSTCMFWTGIDPLSGKKVYVPRTAEEKSYQRALLQCTRPENAEKVKQALIKAGRKDLIKVLLPAGAVAPQSRPKNGYRPHPTTSIRKTAKKHGK